MEKFNWINNMSNLINLDQNKLGDLGCKYISKTKLPKLTTLDLSILILI